MKLTAKEVYDMLLNDDKITQLDGKITFFLGDVNITVKQKDVVGNIMQEWLQGWLENNDIAYAVSENTQMPPDFFLDPDDKKKNLLEVKAFNRNAGPGFDIADFKMYVDEITDKPYMLDVDYLIFGYEMSDEGDVTIKDIWIKKVWEITRRMENWSINLQIKDKVVHKIRPGIWYSDARVDYSNFDCLEDFVSAIEEAVYQNPKTHQEAANWKKTFLKNYKQETGKSLVIPRWDSIKDKYDLKSQRKKEKIKEQIEKMRMDLKMAKEKYGQEQANLSRIEFVGTEKQKIKAKDRVAKNEEKIERLMIKLEEANEKLENLS